MSNESSNTYYSCESSSSFNIWTDIVTPLVISPILLLAKVLWDRYTNKKDKSLLLKNNSKLEKISIKLKDFYWPLYILLLRDYDLWSQFTIFEEHFYDFIESDTESDISDSENDIIRCSYVGVKIKNGERIEYKCNNPVHRNANSKGPLYCLRHVNKCSLQNIEITTYNNESKKSTLIPINTCEPSDVNLKNIDLESGENKINLEKKIVDEDYGGNFSGNKIGEIDGLNNSNTISKIQVDSKMHDNLTRIMLDNHEKIYDIIIKHISKGEPNGSIGKQLIRYMKFITVIKSVVNDGENVDPTQFNAPYPKKLLPLIEKKVFKLQKEYNELIDTFYDM